MNGFFGKIPTLGDFVQRNLPTGFLDAWDAWLQQSLAASKDQLAEAWLDIYLTSPIWRFAIKPGICGNHALAGILMPSVDRVGRYFPLTFVTPFDAELTPFDVARFSPAWFDAAESLALRVLDNDRLDADELAASVSRLGSISCPARSEPVSIDGGSWLRMHLGVDGTDASRMVADELLTGRLGGYSVWWTIGSNMLPPASVVSSGLPEPAAFSHFLTVNETAGPPEVDSTHPAEGGGFDGSLEDTVTLRDDEVLPSAAQPQAFSAESAGRTDAGTVRDLNEDACLENSDSGIWVVADGMGGHEDGELASCALVYSLRDVHSGFRLSDLVEDVENRILDVNQRLFDLSRNAADTKVIGSTVAALLAQGRHCIALWAGDSRIYRMRDGALKCVTRDHSEVEESRANENPAASEPQELDENVITRAVGASADLFLEMSVADVRPKDRYLICSDGLYKEVTHEEIAETLASGTCEAVCSSLVDMALSRECNDNVTAVVVDFVEAEKESGDEGWPARMSPEAPARLEALVDDYYHGLLTFDSYRAQRRSLLDELESSAETVGPFDPGSDEPTVVLSEDATTQPTGSARKPYSWILAIFLVLIFGLVAAVVFRSGESPPMTAETVSPASVEGLLERFLMRGDWGSEAVGNFTLAWESLTIAERSRARDFDQYEAFSAALQGEILEADSPQAAQSLRNLVSIMGLSPELPAEEPAGDHEEPDRDPD